jgi:hypothetical protein
MRPFPHLVFLRQVRNVVQAAELFRYSSEVVGASWPPANQAKSPCPTLKVVGAITDAMNKREDMKRKREMGDLGVGGKTSLVADKVVGTVLSKTVGKVAAVAKRKVLGALPEEALSGSFQEEVKEEPARPAGPEAIRVVLEHAPERGEEEPSLKAELLSDEMLAAVREAKEKEDGKVSA